MVDSIWYGLGIIAILIVVHWYITNDGLPDGQTKGLLAMKRPEEMAPPKTRGRPKFSLKNTP
jgi:hypothetical protein